MKIDVNFLENLRLAASFDDFKVITDQPIRYKGDGSAPGPFDYFLASTVLCASYFVKIYCKARDIPTEDIKIFQDNIIDPENRYKQTIHIQIELPEYISKKDRKGILNAMDRCTVKKVIQQSPEFKIDIIDCEKQSSNLLYDSSTNGEKLKTMIPGKDIALEETIENMISIIEKLGIKIEIASWRNLVPNVWSVHIRDADSPICFANGKGTNKNAALCSALGEHIERMSCNYFYNDYYLGEEIALSSNDFVHYPNEQWFKITESDDIPKGLMDCHLLGVYNSNNELKATHLIDTNSGNKKRGICAIPYRRQSDMKEVFIPVNLIGNIFVSNGMSAGNTKEEARVQALSEIFERAIKKDIIINQKSLPDVPIQILKKYPKILEGIKKLEESGYPILVKDASLNGKYPVMCVTLLNPNTGGVYASFGAHPKFEVALERCLTELLQGRSFAGLDDISLPTFNQLSVTEPNNIIDHFIDSTGVLSWKFFSNCSDTSFVEWNFEGSTEEESKYLINLLKDLGKEIYISDHQELGANACRILVPNFSEIYSSEDLVWDNHNISLEFRKEILTIHQLKKEDLENLVLKLEDAQLDDYTKISEIIGILFDENSCWGQLNIAELKCLIYLAIGRLPEAKDLTEILLTFNEYLPERKLFFQALNTILEIFIDQNLNLDNYKENLCKLFSNDVVESAIASATGEIKFHGLSQTDLNLKGLTKHQQLIESYNKLHLARKQYYKIKKK